MQNLYISAGKALCRYCGEQISTNVLSTHIAKVHPRPAQSMAPTLVAKRAVALPDPLK
jgi:BED zinc finger